VRRREFIAGLGAAAWPVVARAQQPAMPVVGFFSAGAADKGPWPRRVAAFRQGLQETGFTEGRNLVIEYRWGQYNNGRLSALAADLIQRHVAVIAASPRASEAAKALTSTIPIVFMSGNDPVRQGLVSSLSRPGGNVTGVANLAGDVNGKRFDLFHDLVPQAMVIGVLWDATYANAGFAVQEIQSAARALGVPTRVISAGTESEIESVVGAFAQDGGAALFVNSGFLFDSSSDLFAALAARHRIATSGENRGFVDAGGLMSYGTNETEGFREMGRYSGRILKGEVTYSITSSATARTFGGTSMPIALAVLRLMTN
jgi:putative tryptophan/tyrosine transport system substrate-binding protein